MIRYNGDVGDVGDVGNAGDAGDAGDVGDVGNITCFCMAKHKFIRNVGDTGNVSDVHGKKFMFKVVMLAMLVVSPKK